MRAILALGLDERFLRTETAVLRRCNAGVVAAKTSEALKILKTQRVDFVVLCHPLTVEDRNQAVYSDTVIANSVVRPP
jgi:hypothetical protein